MLVCLCEWINEKGILKSFVDHLRIYIYIVYMEHFVWGNMGSSVLSEDSLMLDGKDIEVLIPLLENSQSTSWSESRKQ